MRRLIISVLLFGLFAALPPSTAAWAADSAEISGLVTSAVDGSPQMNVNLTLYVADEDSVFGTAKTNAQGRYTFAGLPGGDFKLRAARAGFVTAFSGGQPNLNQAAVITLIPESVHSHDFAMSPEASITGTVSSGGLPLSGASVTAFTADGAVVRSAKSDETGAYRLGNLLGGDYKLRAQMAGYLTSFHSEQATLIGASVLSLPTGGSLAVPFVLTQESVISGRVIDDESQPIAAATVTAFDEAGAVRSAKTDTEGNYRLNMLIAGGFRVRAMAPDFRTQFNGGVDTREAADPVGVTAGQEVQDLDFTLSRQAVISGAVNSSATGLPIEGATVAIFDAAGTRVKSATSAADGQFTAAGLVGDQQYVVRASASGHLTAYNGNATSADEAQPLTVGAGEVLAIDAISLRPEASISGAVTDDAGNPLADVRVTAFDSAGDAVRTVRTINPGLYAIAGLPEGEYRIRATQSGYLTTYHGGASTLEAAQAVTLAAGVALTEVDVALQLDARVEGTLRDPDGNPIENATATVFDDETGSAVKSARSTSDGFFRIEGLRTGQYKLRASAAGFTTTWYENASTKAEATSFELVQGDGGLGVDVYLSAALVPDDVPPGPVTGLSVVGRSNTFVALSWSNPDDLDLERIVVRRAAGSTPPLSATLGANVSLSEPLATGVINSGLTPGQLYSYAVFAKDTSGNFSQTAATVTVRAEGDNTSVCAEPLAAETTWGPDQHDVYLLDCELLVPSGATLTLDPGTVVKATSTGSIKVAYGGSLVVGGSDSSPVVMTSALDDSAGGDTNGDGAATAPSDDAWGGITSAGSLLLDHADLRYGTHVFMDEGLQAVSILHSSLAHGMFVKAWLLSGELTTVEFRGNTLTDVGPAEAGIFLWGPGAQRLIVADNSVSGVRRDPEMDFSPGSGLAIRLDYSSRVQDQADLAGNIGSDNYANRMAIHANFRTHVEWPTTGLPWLLHSANAEDATTFEGGLTIPAGATVSAGTGIQVVGALDAVGTEEAPIVFDISSSLAVTMIEVSGAARLEHVQMSHVRDIWFRGESATIRNSIFSDGSCINVYVSSQMEISHNDFINPSGWCYGNAMRLVDTGMASPVVIGNTVTNGANGSFRAPAIEVASENLLPDNIDGNVAVNNGQDFIQISGTLAADATWPMSGLPWVIGPDGLHVAAGTTLTIPAGAVVKSGGALFVNGPEGSVAAGSLVAAGTQDQPIVFTSLRDDSVGGDLNGDGAMTVPAVGDWGGIVSEGAVVLTHAEVRFAPPPQ